jgi:hypothetical protein
MVGRERAAEAALRLVGAEHEVVNDELRPAVEELGERLPPGLGVEAVSFSTGTHRVGPRSALPRLVPCEREQR